MCTLVKTHKLNDEGDIFAVWQDDMGRFTTIHDAEGKPITFTVKPPALSSEQLETAVAPHPAFELARKGIEARPDLEKRMTAAAELVEAEKVRLIEANLATVESRSSSKFYMVQNGCCACPDAQFRKNTECAHALAVRMARSLGQEIEGKDREEEKINHALEAAEIGRRQEEDWKNYMLESAEGARRYAKKVYANGGITVKPSVGIRLAEAYGGNGNV